MSRSVASFVAASLMVLATGIVDAETPPRATVAVQFIDGAKVEDITAWIARFRSSDLRVDYRFHTFPALLVSFSRDNPRLVEELAADPLVTLVGGNTPVELFHIPNDSLFVDQRWAYNDGSTGNCNDDIDAIHAWDIATGGPEVVVAIIDHGMDVTHPDLAANCLPGYDFVENKPGVPPHYHGTACAGLIGAIGDNGQGIAGINWNITIVPFRMYDLSHCAAAIDSAVAMGVDVINNSWGIGHAPGLDLLTRAINAANAAGVIVVNAAGNNRWDLDIPGNEKYPASYDLPLNLAVANCFRGRLYEDSNWGLETVDIAAPGLEAMTCMPDSAYGRFSGTSAATPLVTGAIAMLIHQYPDADPAWIVERALTNAEEQFRYADRVPYGRQLNLYRILDTDDRTQPAEISNFQVHDVDLGQATLTWTAPGDDGFTGQLDHYEIWQADSELLELCGLVPVGPGQIQTATLEDLLWSREYTIQVMAVDEARNRSAIVSTTFTTLEPPVIVLPENFVIVAGTTGERFEASTWVHNEGAGTLEVNVAATGAAPWLTITPAEFTVATHDSVEVVYTIDLSGICTTVSAALQFMHNDPEQAAVPCNLIVPVTPAPEVGGPSAAIDFGQVPLGALSSQKIKLYNLGCAELSISNVTMQSGTHFSVGASPRVVPAGGHTSIQVGYHPRAWGRHKDDLLINSNSPFMATLGIGVRGICFEGDKANEEPPRFTNTPNPFNPETEFQFVTQNSGEYRLAIHDLRGSLVRQLDGATVAGMVTKVSWHGDTRRGDAAPSGVYFCTLRVNGKRVEGTLKINLVR
jgi:hypothetical protein